MMRIDKEKIKELKHEVEIYDEVIKRFDIVAAGGTVYAFRGMSKEAKDLFEKTFDLHPDDKENIGNISKLYGHLADEMINRLVDEKTEKKIELEVLENMPKVLEKDIPKEKNHSWQRTEVSSDLKATRLLDKIPSEALSEIKNTLQENAEFPTLQRHEVKQIIKKETGQEIKNDVVDKIIDKISIEPTKGTDFTKG